MTYADWLGHLKWLLGALLPSLYRDEGPHGGRVRVLVLPSLSEFRCRVRILKRETARCQVCGRFMVMQIGSELCAWGETCRDCAPQQGKTWNWVSREVLRATFARRRAA